MKSFLPLVLVVALAGCGGGLDLPGFRSQSGPAAGVDPASPPEGTVRPRARPVGLGRGSAPRSAEAFDTTTASERAAAERAGESGGTRLGTTIASLGAPTEPGFWLKTPLVARATTGRAVYPGTGKSVQLDLLPLDGPATAGSRMSLAAMRVLDAPLTGLPEIEVYAD